MAKKSSKKSSKKTPKQSNKKSIKITKPNISFRQAMSGAILLAVVLLAVGGWLWWKYIFINPDRLMSDMLNRSLSTASVSRLTSQLSPRSSAKQAIRLNYVPQPFSHSVTEIIQASQQSKTLVTTETIGTQTTDFVRYKDIQITGSKSDTKDIVNVWASQKADASKNERPTFLDQAGLALVPFGNLNDSDRQKLVNEIESKKVYSFENSKVVWNNARPQIVYSVNITPSSLISVLKTYSDMTGIGNKEQLNPADYEGSQKLSVTFTIDAISRQLVNISYPDSGRNELYGGYGVRDNIAIPKDTISIEALQMRTRTLGNE